MAGGGGAVGRLKGRLRDLDALGGCAGALGWDELVMLPGGAAAARGRQKAALAAAVHERATHPELGALIGAAEEELGGAGGATTAAADAALAFDRATVRDARRAFDRATRVPEELVKRQAELGSRGYHCWAEAREKGDFDLFAPVLEELLELRREVARHVAGPDADAYNAQIDLYERGMTHARLQEIFSGIKEGLVPLLEDVKAQMAAGRGPAPHPALSSGGFPLAAQEAACREIATAMGFDWERGRLDVSVHPFTGGSHPSDVRITTRYSEDTLLDGIMGLVHETGHALYEQGRNPEQDGLPVSEALSMGIHESQSLLWERMVAQRRSFWTWAEGILHEHLPGTRDAGAEDFYRHVNRVNPGNLIRVDADELSYPLHVLVRFEIERGLFDGSIRVRDLPRVWNAKYAEYLGVEPPSDKVGVLQDVHWSDGSFGYFPSYTLGAMYACQFWEQAMEELGGAELEAEVAAGDFGRLKGWLNEKVHRLGSLHPSADELCEAVTGSKLDPAVFVRYLERKYRALLEG